MNESGLFYTLSSGEESGFFWANIYSGERLEEVQFYTEKLHSMFSTGISNVTAVGSLNIATLQPRHSIEEIFNTSVFDILARNIESSDNRTNFPQT